MNLQSLVKENVAAAFQAAGFDGAPTLVKLSDRPDMSDFQANGALPLAKERRENPRAVAEKIAAFLAREKLFAKVTVDGPGFINMRLSDAALAEFAPAILAGDKCGYQNPRGPKKVVLDYGGPNIAKALHVGHLRPAVIGEAVKRLCRFVGDETVADVHLGDWGLPMGLIITALQEKYPDLPYFSDDFNPDQAVAPVFTAEDLEKMYPEASQRSKQDEDFLARAKENTRLLQKGHPGLRALWEQFVAVSLVQVRRIFDELGVSFDLWRGESHVNERLENMIVRLRENGVLKPDAGAWIIPLGKSKSGNDLPPLIMVKSDGASMYGATDLATIEERVEEFSPDMILYVVDARQGLHFEQVFQGARLLGLDAGVSLEHLGFGTVNGADNKPFKTRDGGVMTLRALIDLSVNAVRQKMAAGEIGRDLTAAEKETIAQTVGVSALKFADLINERMKNYVFDPDKLTSLEGKTGPYVLYALVRMKSMLDKQGADALLTEQDVPTLSHPAERRLLLRLYALPDSVQTAYDNRAPHVIADYLFKLAQDFNSFYHDCPVKNADESTRRARLALVKYALHVGTRLADVLGLSVPEKM